jgi:hypothetical protein
MSLEFDLTLPPTLTVFYGDPKVIVERERADRAALIGTPEWHEAQRRLVSDFDVRCHRARYFWPYFRIIGRTVRRVW